MTQVITNIDLGGVNCYLLKTNSGFIMIDTGFSSRRADLEKTLDHAGVHPGNLSLLILTHGDSDHADNAAFLRNKFGAKIAMHADDAGMVEQGNMGWNRKSPPDRIAFVFGLMMRIMPLIVRGRKFEVFKPDLLIDEDFGLAEYGFAGQVLRLPGHSKGSLGVLTPAGDLFCGDLLYHFVGRPSCLFIDDLVAFNASLERVKQLDVKIIYPGHGKSFPATAIFGKKNN